MEEHWKKCSSCKKPIGLAELYYVCSVSTCRHVRKGYQFCTIECWDAHLGYANHREAWAEEKTSPATANQETTEESKPSRPAQRIMIPQTATGGIEPNENTSPTTSKIETDTLVVVSKVKKLITEQSGFNTSQCCIEALTQKVAQECLKGIKIAEQAERKTVMGRDIK